jgi:hypothetical protein
MGFNKRYVKKDNILNSLNNEYISSYGKADALISDIWSGNFFKNYKCDYNKYEATRNNILENTKFSSNLSDIENDSSFNKLKHLSNILINLENNPTWIDILLTSKILNIEIKEEDKGQFDKLVHICKESIKNKFENE